MAKFRGRELDDVVGLMRQYGEDPSQPVPERDPGKYAHR